MPSIFLPAKRLRRALFGCAALVLAAHASAAEVLQIGDQSGLVQALLQAAGQARPDSDRWHPFSAGPALLEALNSGAIDVGVVGNAPPVFAQAGGSAVRIIGVAEGAQNNNALLLPAGSSVQRVADLKGRRIAVAKGSSGHYLVLAALHEAGLEPRDVELAYVSPVDAQNAFASGHVDAWAVWYPYVGQAVAQGARVLVDGSPWPESGLSFAVASQQALADPQRSVQLAELLGRLARAQDWATAHPAEWAVALAAATHLPLALVQDMLAHQHLRYVPIDAGIIALQQHLADAFAAARLIPRPVQVQTLFDADFNGALPAPH
ncbi:ABC transporter substrate-binding protein [Pseudomonas sp. HR96]|uniref:ABC transporter substrate-binding protein n=1 Tax=Pseudomonas sp. HR96 TaxID=1027966 RepID=UPI002A75E0D8|nr:ABC transporter substrate-binding protein [Pseudomonas sp. HR96]WPP01992.1 ABC transporter substrate-binding protein [Pseudomonas sp. HR96]